MRRVRQWVEKGERVFFVGLMFIQVKGWPVAVSVEEKQTRPAKEGVKQNAMKR